MIDCLQRAACPSEEVVLSAKRAAHRRGNNPLWAVQSARMHALYYYHGDFWISTFQDEPPEQLMDGDEWYSPHEVREIVHGISPRRWDG
jgi:hypothetical protein